MARIETYPLDGNISVNDYVIGTDGDSFNATKNYKVLTFLDYLGRLYNLNSTDLLFNFVDMPSTMISAGEVSTNNYADGTLLMSGVTNIYVSKVTAFGQLVDSILTSIGDEGLTIMFADMGNRNNLGIFTVVSAVDVDANTINLTVTATTTIGSIDAGKVMGIRIGVGGGGVAGDNLGDHTATTTLNMANNSISNANVGNFNDINLFNLAGSGTRLLTVNNAGGVGAATNYVTTDTLQQISGNKTFTSTSTSVEGILYVGGVSGSRPTNNWLALTASELVGGFATGTNVIVAADSTSSSLIMRGTSSEWLSLNLSLITGTNKVAYVPNKNGTIAYLDDIPALPYTEYVAIINQAGTAAPTATVLHNTTGETWTWARGSAGVYSATPTTGGGYDATKTTVFATISQGSLDERTYKINVGSTVVSFVTLDAGTRSDNMLVGNSSITIRIYN